MRDSSLQRFPRSNTLNCKVARRFVDRPALLDTADEILAELWAQYLPNDGHNPLELYLASHQANAGNTWTRPLSQVLVERYCQRTTLNLTDGIDYLTTHVDADPAWRIDIDLHVIETLINDAAPLLVDAFKQTLTSYWSRFDTSGTTPWGWYAQFMKKQLHAAIESHRNAGTLSGFALAAAGVVHSHPDATARSAWENTLGLQVSHLVVDLSAVGILDPDLSSALLIEHADGNPDRDLTLLYTLNGKLHSFDSRQRLLESIARYWPDRSDKASNTVTIAAIAGDAFETQALGLLDQQLGVIDYLAQLYQSRLGALNMNLELDRLTSALNLCSDAEAVQRNVLTEQLPSWLRNAHGGPLMRYSNLLLDVAQAYQNADGKFWLDGIDDAENFSYRQLTARFDADYPGNSLNVRQVRVINYQTTATAAAGQGTIVTSGEVTTVTYTLSQLAIGNLGLLKPGRVALQSAAAEPLPAWLDEHYLRAVISELDIGASYPAMLRRELLADSPQHLTRQRLLVEQLQNQLPALAQELYLRGALPDESGAEHIAEVFSASADDEAGQHWIMRPLGFIKAPGSTIDHPRNTWLIEPQAPLAETCLLYRPLHADTLLQFKDRMALFDAISTPGKLQDDLLQRLPEQDRRFYAHGGFLEPHLFVILTDTSAVPFGAPAPVQLALEAPVSDPGEALYRACVEESIHNFEDRAATTAQTRWERWKALGWLLFNTLLPLAGPSWSRVAWLAQMEVALNEYVDSDASTQPTGDRLALVNLLVNITLLLFSHSTFRFRVEAGEPPAFPGPDIAVQTDRQPAPVPPAVKSAAASQIEFGWSGPRQRLSFGQRKAMHDLLAHITVDTLGSAIPAGPWRGMYLHDDKMYARLDDEVYEAVVDLSRDQPRIVAPHRALGPWLRRDEVGRWVVDLRLQLKGGMPLSGRIRDLQLDRANTLKSVEDRIQADKNAFTATIKQQTTIESLVSAIPDDANLQKYQDKINVLSTFWTTHIEHLKTRNALEPIKNFKTFHAYALYQDSYCQRVLRKILHMRYQPERDQLLQLVNEQSQGEALSDDDVRIAATRLDRLVPLIEAMIDNNVHLRQCQQGLGKLATPQQPQILEWRNLANQMPATVERDLNLRCLRIEGLVNRVSLLHQLSDEAGHWRDRFWSTLQLAIAQRSKLLKMGDIDQEVSARVLRSILEQFEAAARNLNHFVEHIEADSALQTSQQLQEQLDWLLSRAREDVAELPDYPPVSTFQQLRNKVPGLIETTEQGLLLAEPHSDDPSTYVIEGPDSKTPSRTYHFAKGEYVESKPATTQRLPTARSLKRLLKGSDRLMKEAREKVASLHKAITRYWPGDLENLVLDQRTRLLNEVEAIESRLTADNETDEAQVGKDAELVARNLRLLADEFQRQATQMRIAAALAQPPRMGDVMFLLEQRQIQISPVGSRTRLARVKGRPADFLDEYVIDYQGQAQWYAHFHYPAMNTGKVDFTAGHLKTTAQRFMRGQRYTDSSGHTVEVYRAPITGAKAAEYFFNL
ncbi:hypothetical protein ACIPZF_24515 [Pseudomonas sp. NPDC089752]|uniref:hypothetical protein n=1 Tax=Pseudomonas sp. NPDC089752 TaxID=3364472 RepID=UPI00382D62C8